MGKIERDLLDRLIHLPSTVLGFIIILVGLSLVLFNRITMDQFTAFMVVSMPFFFYKKERDRDKGEDKKEK